MAYLLVVIVDGDERIVLVTPLLGLQQKLIVAMHSSTKIAAAWGEAWARAHWNALLQKHEARIQQAQRVAIIVPYRHQAEQNRAAQLARFLAYMPAYLSRHTQAFHIFIVEQTDDGHKFNRGKLLNVGFDIASNVTLCRDATSIQDCTFDAFCFHDVDLLPHGRLGPWYGMFPSSPIHIGSAWSRYHLGKDYVGGILMLNQEQFVQINGFPSNMWGWGGEDDILSKRMKRHNLIVTRPPVEFVGSVQDLEDDLIAERGGVRASEQLDFHHANIQGAERWHAETHHTDGLRNLQYQTVQHQKLSSSATRIVVNLHMGGRSEAPRTGGTLPGWSSFCPLLPEPCPWQNVSALGNRLPSSRCFGSHGQCECMAAWMTGVNPCNDAVFTRGRGSVVVNVLGGWFPFEDLPYRGKLMCSTTMCDARESHNWDAHADATLTSVIGDARPETLFSPQNGRRGLFGVMYMENPERTPGTLRPKFHQLFDVGLTLWPRRAHDIFISYNEHGEEYYRRPPPVPFIERSSALLWLQSNCAEPRAAMVYEFMRSVPVRSGGRCLNNADMSALHPECAFSNGTPTRVRNECLLSQYRTYLAIENSRYENYTTEKLWRGLVAGAVPIYWGAPNVRDYLPHPNASILIEDFPSIAAVADYVKRVNADERLWNFHQLWRKSPENWAPGFRYILRHSADQWLCSFCDRVWAHKSAGTLPHVG